MVTVAVIRADGSQGQLAFSQKEYRESKFLAKLVDAPLMRVRGWMRDMDDLCRQVVRIDSEFAEANLDTKVRPSSLMEGELQALRLLGTVDDEKLEKVREITDEGIRDGYIELDMAEGATQKEAEISWNQQGPYLAFAGLKEDAELALHSGQLLFAILLRENPEVVQLWTEQAPKGDAVGLKIMNFRRCQEWFELGSKLAGGRFEWEEEMMKALTIKMIVAKFG